MSIRILSGDEALSSLSSDRFLGRWQSLYDDCPWSTGCQSPAFATAWYEAYAVENDPLFVVADCPGKPAMEGLLALALERKSGRIVNVGGHQAEYDCWIARPDLGDDFIQAALSLLRERYPDKALCFRYLPPNAPVRWLTDPGPLSGLISSRRVRRPLISLGDAALIEASFRKRSNKSRLNRLRKLCGGEIVFRKITTEAELEEFIDEIALHYDLRQGAVNDSTPFQDDPLKREYHLGLMRAGVLHAVVLQAGSSLVASILSIKSRDYLSVGVFAHSPYLASTSPGKFGMLFLVRAALGEGYRFIDLTPGGEWKERFANDSDVAHDVTVRFDPNAARKAAWGERILAVSKQALKLFGLTPDMMRSSVAMVRRATPAAIIRHIMRAIWNHREYRVYYYEAEKAAALEPERAMRRDCIDDLLRFEATTHWHTRQSFLAGALKRLESGVHAYTSCEDGRLNHCGWLEQNVEKSYFTEVGAEYTYPPNSVVLFDYHTHPEARGRGLYQRAILQMLKDAASVPEARRVYISVLADNGPSRHVIEKLGFDHECSLHRWVRFGQVTHSRTQASDCGSVTTGARTLR